MLKEVYYLIISKNFDRKPIRFTEYPSEREILNAIKSNKGVSARVEKRYEVIGADLGATVESEQTAN